jgi:RNA polymerase sigma-70 factor (ECF subfamily)
LDDFSDDILVAASRRGDKRAYSVLVKRYYRCVFALCFGILGNFHDAEDICQDVMLKGYEKIRRLYSDEHYDQWILRIARNRCFDFLRKQKHSRDYLVRQSSSVGNVVRNNGELENAIVQLPKECRIPLVMYYFDNRSAKTIAKRLRISHSNVCSRLRRARQELHKLLSKEVQDGQ